MKPLLCIAVLLCIYNQQCNVLCNEDEIVNEDERPIYVSPFTPEARKEFYEKEKSMAIGGSIKLNEKEELVNEILMHYKRKEHDYGFENPDKFPPARHFFLSKPDIDESTVFSIIKKLPKGANLHTHLSMSTAGEYLYDLTLEDHLYICREEPQWKLRFFSEDIPEDNVYWKLCKWELVSKLREDEPEFTDWLKSRFTMVVDKPYLAYPSTPAVWKALEERVAGIKEMLGYWPILGDQFYQMLMEMHEDNVMYVEYKTSIPGMYQLNSSFLPIDTITYWKEVLHHFKEEHPGFYGAKLIYTHSRDISNGYMLTVLNTFNKYSKMHDDSVAGFDLGGFEDPGRNLTGHAVFIKDVPHIKPLLLHAGETNWYGTVPDNNLIDAILLNTKRIGHGLAIPKHPEVMRIIKEKTIAVEVCPIANQIFRYVDDLRNHPAAILFANDFPVVIANDGPSFFGYTGLSYDWYMAFMGIASRDADLRMLKQLAINSINYSMLQGEEKYDVLEIWQKKWNVFIDEILDDYKDSKVLRKILIQRANGTLEEVEDTEFSGDEASHDIKDEL